MGVLTGKYFPALTHRDFRIFWCGQCVSLIGSWMQTVGQSWLVYQLTESSFLLGVVGMLQFLPMALFSLPAGALIDRSSKKKILFTVQLLMMLNAFVLSALVWSGRAQYWNIAIIAFVLGILNSIDMPVRQSFVVSLASKEHLMNAISLNSTIFNAARVIGPAVAGVVFGSLGAAMCFLLNGLSFIPVLIGIWNIKAEGKGTTPAGQVKMTKDILESIKYIISKPIMYTSIFMVAITNMIVINSHVTIPVLTKTVLSGDSRLYGYLMTAMGTGAFLGALTLAATSYKGIRVKRQFGAFLGLAFLVFLTGFQGSFYFIVPLLVASGFCLTSGLSSSNSTVQLNSPDNMRGRIMSVYTLMNGISITVGNIYTGIICEKIGVSAAYKINGAVGFIIILLLIAVNYTAVMERVCSQKAVTAQKT